LNVGSRLRTVFPVHAAAISAVALVFLLLALGVSISACGGGVPRIPDTPEAILVKGDEYFQKEKYFQAQEIYKAFLSRFPGHDRSDYAQFMLAESYFGKQEYPLAAVEYQILMSNYGYSEYVDDALYKVGLCYFYESPKSQRDQQKARDALSRFNQFLQTYPDSPLVPEVNEKIKLIHEKLAKKAFDNGYHYFRREKLKAAIIYFDKVIDNYPNNEYWARSVYFKARALEERGETEEAIRHYAIVLSYPEDLSYKGDARRRLERLRE
jgi:outer membrane protein assembly factor BamD